jgi:hypothetical protein
VSVNDLSKEELRNEVVRLDAIIHRYEVALRLIAGYAHPFMSADPWTKQVAREALDSAKGGAA